MNSPYHPPHWADRLLEWFCAPHLLEEVQGDLQEMYEKWVEQHGVNKANRLYVYHTIKFLRPYSIKRLSIHNPTIMLKNYLLIAFRNLWRNKVYSALNIAGLAVGLAVSFLILLFVQHELSYDTSHRHANRIFKASGEIQFGDQEIYQEGFTSVVGPLIKASYPEVLQFVRSSEWNHLLTGVPGEPEKRFYEDKVLFVDSTFLSVFSFKLLSGDRQTLSKQNTLLITPETAKKYFGDGDPIGKTIAMFGKSRLPELPKEYFFIVTGIIEPSPSNSTIEYNLVTSFDNLSFMDKDQYAFTRPAFGNYTTYFLLNAEQASSKVLEGLNEIIPSMGEGVRQEFLLTKVPDLHLHGHTTKANEKYIYIFLGVAFLILLLALINYISLTTARATQRAKEVGVRKVIGAVRIQLVSQFFGESLLMLAFSFLLALLLMWQLLPLYYQLIGVHISPEFLWHPKFIFLIGGILMISGLLAGSYPALLLSGFSPVTMLKGKFSSQNREAINIRKLFTVIQFTACIALVICSIIIQYQLNLLYHKDLGLNKEQLLIIPVAPTQDYQALQTELKEQAGVMNVAASTSVPYKKEGINSMLSLTSDQQEILLNFSNIDENFIPTYSIEWKERLEAAKVFAAGAKKVIINETAAKAFGIEQDPLGKTISVGGQDGYEVIGVVKDYHFTSLQQTIAPLVLFPVKDTQQGMLTLGGYLTLRLHEQANIQESIQKIENVYKKHNAAKPLEYFFLDEAFDQLYKYQDRLANISYAFTLLTVMISCLGLFGLTVFTLESRAKEIGIRKILGASVSSIMTLITKDFMYLMIIAFLFAAPIAWYVMHIWLKEFSYKVDISWWIFAVAGSVTLLLALFTISFQSIKAALANPVDSLRNE